MVIKRFQGVWHSQFKQYASRVIETQAVLQRMMSKSLILPREDHGDFHRHVFRELNTEADHEAGLVHTLGRDAWIIEFATLPPFFRCHFDGSKLGNRCSCAWLMYASMDPGVNDDSWYLFARMQFPLMASSSTAAELEAAASAHFFFTALLDVHSSAERFLKSWIPHSYP